jgi:hypothetical protein
MEDGWEHIADFNNEQKAINSYYDCYLNHPEVQLVDSEGDVLYRQRNHNVKGKQRDERLEAENTCAECGEIVADEDIIGDGTNRGLCCVPDYYDEESKEAESDSKNLKMALGITAVGIGLAAVLGKDKITKLFDKLGL